MKTKMLKNLFAVLIISVIAVSCQTRKQAEGTSRQQAEEPQARMEEERTVQDEEKVAPKTPEEYAVSEEAVMALDRRIREFNRELTDVEKQVKDSNGKNSVDKHWEKLEIKREEVNNYIEQYNNAIERDAGAEAAQVRENINRILSEMELEVDNIREGFEKDTERQEPLLPD